VELTQKEEEEKERLLENNEFSDWSRREFRAFINANEKYGRNNLESIAKDIESKSMEEVGSKNGQKTIEIPGLFRTLRSKNMRKCFGSELMS
jgi:hypothetical protein